jgi:hypothetical protein
MLDKIKSMLYHTVHRARENPRVVMAALVRCRRNAYYQADYTAAIGGEYDTPEAYTTTLTENIKQLTAACGECTFTVYCVCCGNIPD